MSAKTKTLVMWICCALCLAVATGLLCGFFAVNGRIKRGRTYTVSATVHEGTTVYVPKSGGGYRYGPTMMYNESGVLEAWFSSLPESPQYSYCWDVLTYRSTSDYGEHWSNEYVSIAPLNGTEEAFSVCDPAVIFMDGFYYMFYTSTIEGQGRYNNVYCARSVSPDGDWQRWNGSGWGGTVVKPVVVYGSDAEHYGIGEPSVVIVDGKLYLYYTYKGVLGNGQTVNQTRLTIGEANENFPLTLSEYGVVVGDKPSDEDSLDVKYAEDYNVFIGVTTDKRMSYRSRIKMYWSYDGKNFKEAEVNDTAAKKYSHNIGITGDGSGHIKLDEPQFICYAYSEGGFSWGNWNTEFQQITFSVKEIYDSDKAANRRITREPDFEGGKAPPAWAMTEASAYRTAYDAIDGDRTTFYSSVGHNVTGINDYQSGRWYNESLAIKSNGSARAMIISPRLNNGNGVYGFPKAFSIQCSDDGVIWRTVKSYSDYTVENDSPVTFSFGKKVKAKYFRILATELSQDEFGTYILQISEIKLKK